MQKLHILALDVGTKRIGVAYANYDVRIAVSQPAIMVNGAELEIIGKLQKQKDARIIVIGFPRNNSGETTRQTESVEEFAKRLREYLGPDSGVQIRFQDESWTSEEAKDHLTGKQPLTRADRNSGLIDSEAATIILQDFLDSNTEGIKA